MDSVIKYPVVLDFQRVHYYILVDGLANGDFDVLMGDITITTERQNKIDFVAHQKDDIVIIKKHSNFNSNIFSFLFPISWDVWVSILTSLILVIIVLHLTINFSTEDDFRKSYSLWFCIAALFCQGIEQLPRYVIPIFHFCIWIGIQAWYYNTFQFQ